MERTWREKIEGTTDQILAQIKRLIDEGNVRRVLVKQQGRVIAEFPLTVGVVGTVIAPVAAAIGALPPCSRTARSRSRRPARLRGAASEAAATERRRRRMCVRPCSAVAICAAITSSRSDVRDPHRASRAFWAVSLPDPV